MMQDSQFLSSFTWSLSSEFLSIRLFLPNTIQVSDAPLKRSQMIITDTIAMIVTDVRLVRNIEIRNRDANPRTIDEIEQR